MAIDFSEALVRAFIRLGLLCLIAVPAAGQDAYLKASNTHELDQFGWAIATSGDTLVVGAPFEDSDATGLNGDEDNQNAPQAGAVFIFVRSGSTWNQQAYLKASNADAGDAFGDAVGISGDTIVVGATHEQSEDTGVDADQSDNSFVTAGAA